MSKTATSILNELIQTLKDGQDGFRTAADDVKSETVKALFADCSLQRYKYIEELQTLAKGLGEPHPADSAHLASKLHRGWINIKAVLMTRDEHAILAECERGEDVAVADYKKALEAELPPAVREVVQMQADGIKSAHDRVKEMRDKYAKS